MRNIPQNIGRLLATLSALACCGCAPDAADEAGPTPRRVPPEGGLPLYAAATDSGSRVPADCSDEDERSGRCLRCITHGGCTAGATCDGGICLRPALLVADRRQNRIVRLDPATGEPLGVFVPEGSPVGATGPATLQEPRTLAIGPDGMLWVGSFNDGRVHRRHPDTGEPLGLVYSGALSEELVGAFVLPSGTFLLSNDHEQVVALDGAQEPRTFARRGQTGRWLNHPHAMVRLHGGLALVLHEAGPEQPHPFQIWELDSGRYVDGCAPRRRGKGEGHAGLRTGSSLAA